MAEMTAQELQSLAAHQANRISELEAAESRRELDAALTAAVAATGKTVLPGSEGQLLELLRPSAVEYKDPNGRRQFGGPSFIGLKEHVAGQLGGALQHFVGGARPSASQSPSWGQPSAPIVGGTVFPTMATLAPDAGAKIHEAIRGVQNHLAANPDPRLDISQGMALRPSQVDKLRKANG